jgi:hypothetical protein
VKDVKPRHGRVGWITARWVLHASVGAAFSRDSRLQGAGALPGAPTEKIISGIPVKQSGPHHPVRAAAG